MRPSNRRARGKRIPIFETMESRQLLSAQPLVDATSDSVAAPYDPIPAWSMSEDVDDSTGLTQVRADYGLTGRGQTVVVIDSGVAYTHEALGGGFGAGYRVVGGYDFTGQGDSDPFDDGTYGAHGTHVTGIIASTDERYEGVAPGADVVALRVFDDGGAGGFAQIEAALRWVHDHRNDFANPITTVNLSVGTTWNGESVPDWATLEEELAQLEADGMFISVAAGNRFANLQGTGLSYPAVSSHVVAVGAVDANGSLSYFSQRAQGMIAAPGRAIQSTLPDYVGNHNGVNDDFGRFSGTSMAAPYVAGASMLLREAYALAGVENVTQETLYELMVNTADTIHDPITGLNYHRLNLTRAVDAITPSDDFGSTEDTAHDLGTIDGGRTLAGILETADDVDWFTFTAGATGSFSIQASTADRLTVDWQRSASTQAAFVSPDGTISFSVVAGNSYTIGLSANNGSGNYSLEMSALPEMPAPTPPVETPPAPPTPLEPAPVQPAPVQPAPGRPNVIDWGQVTQKQIHNRRIDDGGQQFAMTSSRSGMITFEAFFSHGAGDVDLRVYDATGQLLAISEGMRHSERIDLTAAAGETFYLHAYVYGGGTNEDVDFRVTNLVSQQGRTVRVFGSEMDDDFAFVAGTNIQLTVNEVDYQFQANRVDSIIINGLGGRDSATLTGSGGRDQAVLYVGEAHLTGEGYRVQTTDVETATVYGSGGVDQVVLHDSAGNDSLTVSPHRAVMSGNGYRNVAEGFETVEAIATRGNRDLATLYDSAANDTFVASPTSASLSGGSFSVRVDHFDKVEAHARAGGRDTARFHDSAGNDRFVATVDLGAMSGRGFNNRAHGFETVHAHATAGGRDTARMFDSPGNDCFTADPVDASLTGQGYARHAHGFDLVRAYATAGGYDTARLVGSTGNDRFVSTVTSSTLRGSGFYNQAKFFEAVYAESAGGQSDRATLIGVRADNVFRAAGQAPQFGNDVLSAWGQGGEQLQALAHGRGNNATEVAAVDFLLQLDGTWR